MEGPTIGDTEGVPTGIDMEGPTGIDMEGPTIEDTVDTEGVPTAIDMPIETVVCVADFTLIIPVIEGCTPHTYGKSPSVLKVKLNVRPCPV